MDARNEQWPPSPKPVRPGREPVFNLPLAVTVLVGLLVGIHAVRAFLLTDIGDRLVVLTLAFIPARYGEAGLDLPLPAAAWWSPLTYALIHVDWLHLIVNLGWFLAFATPVARRLGAPRLLAICGVATLGGAVAYYLAHRDELVVMYGASAAVAGLMAAASRFAFSGRLSDPHAPALSLVESFSNPMFLAFAGVWLVMNLLFGSGIVPIAGVNNAIAWEAHLGGFIAGLLAFSLLDRR